MPFPIIPGVVVLVASSLMGLYKTYRGIFDIKKAKRIGESAENRHGTAVKSLDSKRQETLEKAASYGRLIEECRTTTVRQLAEFLAALQKRPGMRGIPIPDDVEVAVATLEEYRAKILDAPNDLLAASSAVGAGSAAGASALGLVGLFGTASTGTAIGGLSGAAASNAVLAWLGGGSLASGGLGMAGGAGVLGGIAVAPVLLVTGFVLASKGEKILTQARAYEAKADREVARIDELKDVLGQIQVRT